MNRPSSHFSIIVSYIFLFCKIFSLHFYLFCILFSFSSFYLIAVLHNFYYVFIVFLLLFSQLFISLLLFFIITQKRPRGLNRFRPSGSIFTFGHNSCFHMLLYCRGTNALILKKGKSHILPLFQCSLVFLCGLKKLNKICVLSRCEKSLKIKVFALFE